jgi:hypothetical protein
MDDSGTVLQANCTGPISPSEDEYQAQRSLRLIFKHFSKTKAVGNCCSDGELVTRAVAAANNG